MTEPNDCMIDPTDSQINGTLTIMTQSAVLKQTDVPK